MTLSEIRIAIHHAEQRARYYDAAEGKQWFAERWPRERNEAELALLRAKLEAHHSARSAPYPFCLTPGKCAGKGYCPRDIACND